MSIADIGRKSAQESSSDSSSSSDDGGEYERLDTSGMQFVKMHPGPTAIRATISAIRYFPPAPDSEREGTATLVLENPSVPEDEEFEGVSFFESTTEKGDDFKIVNADDENVDVYDAGVSVGQMFESDEVEDLPDGKFCLKMSANAMRSVVRTLDVKGLPNLDLLRTDDYEPEIQDNGYPTTNDALIEKCPDNDEDNYTPPQYSRDPQLRPDVQGREVVIMMQRLARIDPEYEGGAFWATVLADVEDDREAELLETYVEDDFYTGDTEEDFLHDINGDEFLKLSPTDEFEPDQDLLVNTQWITWHWPSEERIEQLREEQGVTVDE